MWPTHTAFRTGVCFGLACLLAGCASRSQLAKIHAEKEQLKALVESEKRRSAELAARLETTTQRVAEAERELALASSGGKRPATSTLVKTELKPGTAAALEQWAASEPLLKYDRNAQAAQVQIRVTYADDDHLTLEGRRELDKVADLLSSQTAARCGARVVGIESQAGDSRAAARAGAALAYLRRRGIDPSRLEQSSRTASSLVDEEGRKLGGAPQSVEIEVFERSTGGKESVASDPASKGDGWTSSSGRR